MNKTYITLKEGQFIPDILDCLLTNTIYFKKLTGIRATTSELQAERNSLIAESHVPVIKGKEGFFPVHKGIRIESILDYLKNDSIKYKKIMTTPESFNKVKIATELAGIDLYKEFFFLFDECDRTVKDVDYRKTIILPMEDFFKFENKAFISATAIVPSDPRFEEQNFEIVEVLPDYDYSKEMKLIITNSTFSALNYEMNTISDRPICIFLNSVKCIMEVIRQMDITEESHIYCSEEKMYPLRAQGYKAFDNINVEKEKDGIKVMKYAKYNFFTCRFNAAVDMIMAVKPTVIMMTNLYAAEHTAIDPNAEAVQIVGRFRRGVNDIIAISNIKDMEAKTEMEATSYLAGCKHSYEDIKRLLLASTTEGARDTLAEALKLVTYANFVNSDGSDNHYMYDCFLYDESVKMKFQSEESLITAYTNDYFKPIVEREVYPISDEDYKFSKSGVSFAQIKEVLITALDKLTTSEYKFEISNSQEVVEQLRQSFPDIVRGYFSLGAHKLRNCYSLQNLKSEMKLKYKETQKSNYNFIKELQEIFYDGLEDTTKELVKLLDTVIKKVGLDLEPTLKLLNDFFVLSKRKSLKGSREKGYAILKSRFNRVDND